MIDDGNDEPWHADVTSKLTRFRQGSLVPSPPFAYHASGAHPIWKVSRLASTSDVLVLLELDPADRPPFGIITSHSCDVDEEGRNRKPWVQIAPVYELPSADDRLGNVRSWKSNYLAPVTALGPNWVADLRIEIPVEKSWLVTQTPRDAFVSTEEFRKFGDFCADNRGRNALATAVLDDVLKPLQEALNSLRQRDRGRWDDLSARVKHLYVEVWGDQLNPTSVQLVFVSEESLPSGLAAELETWWEQRFGSRSVGRPVLANRYLTFEEVRFVESRHWFELSLSRVFES